jgi:tight adherence protein C
MTVLLFLLGISLVGATVRLLIHAAVLPRLQLSAHLRGIQGYGFENAEGAPGVESRDHLGEAVAGLATRIGKLAMQTFPGVSPLKRGDLAAAGIYDSAPETVHGYRVLAALLLGGVVLFLVAASGSVSMIMILMIVAATAAGWFLPASVIRGRGQKRLMAIDRDLPDLIDLLTATVEAGMGISGSINLVADRFKGALGDELRLTLRQQTLGMSMGNALSDMSERCDTPSVRAFVRTVTRGESLGGSIGPILRELAHDTRRRRRQSAREQMQKAPVKMLFPLMLLIFPALLIELMYPAIWTLLHNLGGGGG